jgi:hypothetical protein
MRDDHDYSILGHSRATIGRYLGGIAAAISGGSVFVAGLGIEFAQAHGFGDFFPPIVVWPVTATAVWIGLHWLFANHVWKWRPVASVINVPNLSGSWTVTGRTLDADKNVTYQWSGEITITQTWERLKVRLKTAQSSSFSISAALFREAGAGFRLTYPYVNEPSPDQRELQTHVGFADLLFSSDLSSADGDYFNNKGRTTQGVMRLERSEHKNVA